MATLYHQLLVDRFSAVNQNNHMYHVKRDKFQKSRGGYSRILDISCEHCGEHICYYQKDGPGSLRRMYVDRIIGLQPIERFLTCPNCQHELALRIVWKKENRPAYRLFVDSINKVIVDKSVISN